MFNKSKKKSGWFALKLDMEKAYDQVEWDFLWATLKAFGFNETLNTWIKTCVTTVSYSIYVNKNSTELITPTQCLRRGDPLSSFSLLFVWKSLLENYFINL